MTTPDALARQNVPERFAAWLTEGLNGTMDWLAETQDRRADPRVLWPDVRSIVMLGMNYGPESNPLDAPAAPGAGVISVYARHRDYHDIIKGRLKEIAGALQADARALGHVRVKVFVDTAPVMEKPLAAAAGLGWQGRHTNLVSRDFGSWLFLGAIFTSLELAPDAAETDHCGACRSCLDICPTQAFAAPYRLDARRCISYLTIEHREPIAHELRPLIGNRIYGCDDCLAVCPWNKFASVARETKLQARADLVAPSLRDLVQLDDAAFRQHFSGSPVKRIGRAQFIRNVLIAIGNSGDAGFRDVILARLDDLEPQVRAMAVWAAGRLLTHGDLQSLAAQFASHETDADVQAEWSVALNGGVAP